MSDKTFKPDALNRRILEVLQLNAAMTNQELAGLVNLSASACHGRVRALEKAGVIRRYLADIDVDRLAPSVSAFVEVTLENHRPADFRAFDTHIAGHPEFVWSYKISGSADYLMLAIVPDMPTLREVTEGLLETDVPIAKLTTIPILERVKTFAGLPLQDLLSAATDLE